MRQINPENKTDRRNYFRIDDVTILYHRILVEGEENLNQDNVSQLAIDRLTLKARFEMLTRELKPLSNAIGEGNPMLARYLAAIDNKLNMLSEVLMDTAVDELDEKPQKVNISAGGLSFVSESPITAGSLLELRIILLPSNVGIYSHARVVACNKDADEAEGNNAYKVAVEFVRMDEEFRDLISRHVLGREQAAMMSNHDMKK